MIKETWRGWQGHFCCSCSWHLNTSLEEGDRKIIVSTVGQYMRPINNEMEELNANKDSFYETMVFEANNDEWNDIDVTKQIHYFNHYPNEKEAQKGHYDILKEVRECEF